MVQIDQNGIITQFILSERDVGTPVFDTVASMAARLKPRPKKPQLKILAEAMKHPQVVVADFVSEPLDVERQVLNNHADVVCHNAHHEDDLIDRIENASAIMLYHEISLTRRTIERLNCCKIIVRCGAGYDNVDIEAAIECGIAVANVPDYGSEEVADSAIGMLLCLARGTHFLNSRLRDKQGSWHYTQAAPLFRLRGRVLGIVGLGRIGSAVALRAKSIGMDVAYFDPYKPDGYDKALGIRRADSVESLFRQSNVLSLHCPLTAETRHLVNADSLQYLPRGAYLINTARGDLIDLYAIPDAIASGLLAGAGIDVLTSEPPTGNEAIVRAWRDPGHPAYHRVILNPHSSFYCEEGLLDMRVKGSRTCLDAISGNRIRNLITLPATNHSSTIPVAI